MRYIDADTVFSELTNRYKFAKGEARKAYREALDIVTAVEEIEVVRCRDCGMWSDSFEVKDLGKLCMNFRIVTKPDFYCAWGSKE